MCDRIAVGKAMNPSAGRIQTMMSTFLRRFVPWTGATLLLVAISAPGLAQEKKYKPFVVTAPDGVTIAGQWQCIRPRDSLHPRLLASLVVMAAAGRERSRQGIPHHNLRPAWPRQFRQAVGAGEVPGVQGPGG